MYNLVFTKTFDESYTEIVKTDQVKVKSAQKALNTLLKDPFYPSLKSHKVATRKFGECWSSWITGDLRLIWNFDRENKLTILLLSISAHSGSHKGYK